MESVEIFGYFSTQKDNLGLAKDRVVIDVVGNTDEHEDSLDAIIIDLKQTMVSTVYSFVDDGNGIFYEKSIRKRKII